MLRKRISFSLSLILSFQLIFPPQAVVAQIYLPDALPPQVFTPLSLKGMRIFPHDPFKIEFFVDPGKEKKQSAAWAEDIKKQVKYFLTTLTVPQQDLWANLSPGEKNRIMTPAFAKTEMGKDLLGQDYQLKKISAAFLHPDHPLGIQFWKKLKQFSHQLNLSESEQRDLLNRIWIMPKKAVVYEHGDVAFVIESRLEVRVEETRQPNAYSLSTDVLRQTVLPEIEKEVNTGEHFAPLRQIYQAMILAAWYKRKLREGLLRKIYVGKNKTEGIETLDKQAKERIYEEYLRAFREGAYKLLKEEYDPQTQSVVTHQYFSGGVMGQGMDKALFVSQDNKMLLNNASFRGELLPEFLTVTIGLRAIFNSDKSVVNEEQPLEEFPALLDRIKVYIAQNNYREALEAFKSFYLKEAEFPGFNKKQADSLHRDFVDGLVLYFSRLDTGEFNKGWGDISLRKDIDFISGIYKQMRTYAVSDFLNRLGFNVTQEHSRSPMAWWLYIQMLLEFELYEKAQEALDMAKDKLDKKEDILVYRQLYAQVYLKTERKEEALAYQRKTIEQFPKNVWAEDQYIYFLRAAKGKTAAMEATIDAMRKFPREEAFLARFLHILHSSGIVLEKNFHDDTFIYLIPVKEFYDENQKELFRRIAYGELLAWVSRREKSYLDRVMDLINETTLSQLEGYPHPSVYFLRARVYALRKNFAAAKGELERVQREFGLSNPIMAMNHRSLQAFIKRMEGQKSSAQPPLPAAVIQKPMDVPPPVAKPLRTVPKQSLADKNKKIQLWAEEQNSNKEEEKKENNSKKERGRSVQELVVDYQRGDNLALQKLKGRAKSGVKEAMEALGKLGFVKGRDYAIIVSEQEKEILRKILNELYEEGNYAEMIVQAFHNLKKLSYMGNALLELILRVYEIGGESLSQYRFGEKEEDYLGHIKPLFHNKLISNYMHHHRYANAIREAKKALSLYPGNVFIHTSYLFALVHNTRIEEAVEKGLEWIVQFPDNEPIHYALLAAIHEISGPRLYEIIGRLREIQQRYPDSTIKRFCLGNTLSRLKRLNEKEAKEIIEVFDFQKWPDLKTHKETYLDLAKAHARLHKIDEAKILFEQYLNQFPIESESQLTHVLTVWGYIKSMEATTKRLQEGTGLSKDQLVNILVALSKTNNWRFFYEELELVEGLYPADSKVKTLRATSYFHRGEFDRGVEYIEDQMADILWDDRPAFYNILTKLYLGKHDLKHALENAKKASTLYPDDPSVHVMYMAALMRNDKFDEAIPIAIDRIRDFPDNERVYNVVSNFIHIGGLKYAEKYLDTIKAIWKADSTHPLKRILFADQLLMTSNGNKGVLQHIVRDILDMDQFAELKQYNRTYFILTRVHLLNGDITKAIEVFNQLDLMGIDRRGERKDYLELKEDIRKAELNLSSSEQGDRAIIKTENRNDKYGGIDVRLNKLPLETLRDEESVPEEGADDVWDFKRRGFRGFDPIIIRIAPTVNLPLLLGIAPEKNISSPVALRN